MIRLRTQLIWAFALVLLIPSFIIGYYAQRTIAGTILERAQTERLHEASDRALKLDEMLQSDRNDALFLARAPAVRRFVNATAAARDLAGLETYFKDFMRDSRYKSILLVDNNGQVTLNVTAIAGHEEADRDNLAAWLGKTAKLAPGNAFISPPTRHHIGNLDMFCITFGLPLFDAANQRVGSLLASADVSAILAAADLGLKQETTYVIDGTNGRYLLNPTLGPAYLGMMEHPPTLYDQAVSDAGYILAQNLQSGSLFDTAERPGIYQTFVRLRPIGFESLDWVILYHYPVSALLAAATKARDIIFLLALAAGLLALAAATFIATGITRPVIALSRAAKALNAGDWQAALPRPPRLLPTITEVHQLIESFGMMRDGLLKSRRDLQDYNQRLEQTVAERTAELAVKSDEYRDAKARLETVIASITDGICVTDNDGLILMMNPAAREMLGMTYTNVLHVRFNDLQVSLERPNSQPFPADGLMLLRGLAGAPAIENGALIIVRPSGHLPVSFRSSVILSGEERVGSVTVFRDVTTEFETDRAKSEFVSVASHQLRTPLTAIRWYAEAVADLEYGALTPEQMEAVKIVCVSSRRMSSLIDTLLNVARLESGRLRIAPEPSDLPTLMREVMTENLPAVSARHLTVKTDFAAAVPLISFDPNLVKVIMQNLLTNAIKYTLPGGTVTIAIRTEGDQVMTTVTDTGIGIPEDQRRHIFEKMFRASNVTTTDTEGNGLGLYIAKAVAEQCGGHLGFESQVGVGTSFHFTLPIKGVPYHEGNRSLITKIPEV